VSNRTSLWESLACLEWWGRGSGLEEERGEGESGRVGVNGEMGMGVGGGS
jgi:hypothetical protein